MKISRTQLAAVLAQRFDTAKDAKQLEREVAAYLLSERRVGELESLLRDISQYRADHGHVEADATSAFPLSAAAEAELKAVLKKLYPKAARINVNQRLDESVIGGVKLELANQQLDTTVRADLNRFKQLTSTGN